MPARSFHSVGLGCGPFSSAIDFAEMRSNGAGARRFLPYRIGASFPLLDRGVRPRAALPGLCRGLRRPRAFAADILDWRWRLFALAFFWHAPFSPQAAPGTLPSASR